MLRKANRLRRSQDFRVARRRGRSFSSPTLILHVMRRPGTEVRAGFSVSKKIGKAVVRNRVRRLMREGVRANLMQVTPGHDLILTARPPAASSTFWEIRQTIEELFRRSDLLQTPNS